MKKIFFGKHVKTTKIPFWQPWGYLGYFGRLLCFLLMLLVLLFLLSLFRQCSYNKERVRRTPTTEVSDPIGSRSGEGRNTIGVPGAPTPDDRALSPFEDMDPAPSPRDDSDPIAEVSDPTWNRPVEDGDAIGLPKPDDNTLPPFEDMEPVPNPENDGATEIYPNLLYVIFDSDANDETFKTFAKRFTSLYRAPEHKIQYYNTGSKTAVLAVPERTRDEICRRLPSQISEVDFLVVPVEVMTQYNAVTPNDPAFKDADKSWYFNPIQAYEAWGITQGSPEIIVGIVDSYMDLKHPEIDGDRCIFPYSVVSGDADVAPRAGVSEDYAGHGTLVTAVAVGNANNSEGSSGIAPKCRFIPVSMGESINTITMVEGLLYCMYHGASVINLSCGADFPEEITKMPLDEQIEFSERCGKPQEEMWDYVFKLAEKHNAVIVWAAGNENCFDAMDASKRNPNTLRVSAVDRNLKRADFSNYGNFKDKGLYESTISAPGVDIWGALPGNSYDAWAGTSFSAPIITGVVALIKSENKDLTSAQIIKILQSTGKPINGAPEIGNLVQIKDALTKAKRTVASALTD